MDQLHAVWVSPRSTMEDSKVLALDPLYGVEADNEELRVVTIMGDSGELEYFYVAANKDEVLSKVVLERWYRRTMDSNHDELDIMGDFWPIEVGVGQGYDVYCNEVGVACVHWLEGDGA